MARYWCERCGTESNTLSAPHMCKDIAKRLARRQAQVEAVRTILADYAGDIADDMYTEAAEAIVAQLASMGVTDD
jgi:hypothetical protein